ncbi:hypothetical protein EVAR_86676_1 [Eumeta japonica]|uniref:Reverse transcriptase domain-containing protein n=1 Tax=Eumeta variegata TaxID=151549 RepID=A0A4C1XXF5_EUMVA|nr:hypothetical protein EVAR_86676_1 [Eumeta japonica]
MRAYLKIVPVELYGPEGSMKVHAPDEGSTVTLIDEQVANRIGAKGRRETLRVSSVGGNEITDENRGLSRPINTVHHLRPSNASDIELNDIVKRHFEIESLGVAPRKPSHDPEERALVLLDSNSVRLPSGQFETCLLWKSDNETMPESYDTAMRRLRSIEKKLSKNDNLKHEYCEQINNLLKNGYAEPAPNQSTSERLWYLPHFAVTHPQKKKVRLVFDAAARTNGKCLNDALLTGPDLIRSLLGVLVRFRQGRVAVSADIKEMFLRVKIRKDRDSLRFLWRNNMHENPQEYRMTSLIFGAASSPCTAIYIKNRNASEFELEYPEACKAIRLDHYVDDFLKSFNSIEEAGVFRNKFMRFIERQPSSYAVGRVTKLKS